jgi:hypothetical protein
MDLRLWTLRVKEGHPYAKAHHSNEQKSEDLGYLLLSLINTIVVEHLFTCLPIASSNVVASSSSKHSLI